MERNYYICIIILTSILIPTLQLEYRKHNITSGLLFYELNEAAISYSTWRLTYFYNLTEYYDEIDKLNLLIKEIDKICDNNKELTECNSMLLTIHEYFRNIYSNTEKIESFDINRQKRAPLYYLGKAMSWLYGIADEDDVKDLNNKINSLGANLKDQNDSLLKNLVIIKKSAEINNGTYQELKGKIKRFEEILSKTQLINNIKQEIHSLGLTATYIINMYEQTHKDILDILENSLQGKIINLISQTELRHNLKIIENNLTESQKLPINLKIQNVYNLFTFV